MLIASRVYSRPRLLATPSPEDRGCHRCSTSPSIRSCPTSPQATAWNAMSSNPHPWKRASKPPIVSQACRGIAMQHDQESAVVRSTRRSMSAVKCGAKKPPAPSIPSGDLLFGRIRRSVDSSVKPRQRRWAQTTLPLLAARSTALRTFTWASITSESMTIPMSQRPPRSARRAASLMAADRLKSPSLWWPS